MATPSPLLVDTKEERVSPPNIAGQPGLVYLKDCVHCGLCLPSCPTYLMTGVEMSSPRGRIAMVRALGEGRAGFSPEFVKHLDQCLGCLACQAACPSGVVYGRALEETREVIERTYERSPADRGMRWLFLHTLPYPQRLRRLLHGLFWYQRSGLSLLVRKTRILSLLSRRLAQMEALLPRLPRPRDWKPMPERTQAVGSRRGRVALLTGCAQRFLLPELNRATSRVLAAAGYEVFAPAEQGCCGALHLHGGDVSEGRRLAKALITAFEQGHVDFIVANAAGCGAAMKEYGHLLAEDAEWRERAEAFSAKVRDVSEIVAGIPWNGRLRPVPASVTYHEACHLVHAQGIRTEPRSVLHQIPGIRLVELSESDVCCGSAGTYNLLQPEMAHQLLTRKLARIREADTDFVAAGNIGCLLQIQQGLRQSGSRTRAIHPVELLDWSLTGTINREFKKEKAMPAEVGQAAPDFMLVGTDLKAVSLKEFANKNVVLAFYPAAFTGVCEKELCTFRDALNDFASANTAVVGVSVDSPFANKEFAAKNGLNFPLLSDLTRDVIRKYDVVFNDLAGIKGFTVAKRSVFVIDRSGTVRYRWVAPEPKVEPNYGEVAAAVKKLA